MVALSFLSCRGRPSCRGGQGAASFTRFLISAPQGGQRWRDKCTWTPLSSSGGCHSVGRCLEGQCRHWLQWWCRYCMCVSIVCERVCMHDCLCALVCLQHLRWMCAFLCVLLVMFCSPSGPSLLVLQWMNNVLLSDLLSCTHRYVCKWEVGGEVLYESCGHAVLLSSVAWQELNCHLPLTSSLCQYLTCPSLGQWTWCWLETCTEGDCSNCQHKGWKKPCDCECVLSGEEQWPLRQRRGNAVCGWLSVHRLQLMVAPLYHSLCCSTCYVSHTTYTTYTYTKC